MMPLIAVPCRRLQHGGEPGRSAQGVLVSYLAALSRVGAAAFLIPIQSSEAVLHALGVADGLLLVGGEGVGTVGRVGAGLSTVDEARDVAESALAKAAFEKGLPVLGICRGMQVLNVALGGRNAPISPSGPQTIRHANSWDDKTSYHHPVQLSAGSLLCRLVDGRASVPVNSAHSDAVHTVAPGFEPSAVAPDGIVEAMEFMRGAPFVGVQWHPEALVADGDQLALGLFQWLHDRAVMYRSRP